MFEVTESLLAEVREFRKELHRIPEVAGHEFETCAAIRKKLAEIQGVRILDPFLETDTVAFIDGNGKGKNITLRADIDALALAEETGVDFVSSKPGFMHACGHDVHSAILIGAAKILAAKRHEFSGSVRLVFQPGEEGKVMARELLAAGALDAEVKTDYCAALHVEPGLPVGTIGLREGCMASSCLHFEVEYIGKGGHGSLPHLSRNPILAAAAAVNELQYVVTNRIDVQKPAVLSICKFSGGTMDNVIPERCMFLGTLRSLDNETAEQLATALKEVCEAVATVHGMRCEVTFGANYPAVINSASGVDSAVKVAEKLGLNVKMLSAPAMSSEDFSCFLLNSPDGVFIRLGAGEDLPPLHNVKFLPPETVLRPGIEYMVATALAFLKK